jgi:hypothetical protein
MTSVRSMKPTGLCVVTLFVVVVVITVVAAAFCVVVDGDRLRDVVVVWTGVVGITVVVEAVVASVDGEDFKVVVGGFVVVASASTLWWITGVVDGVNTVVVDGSSKVVETVPNEISGVDVEWITTGTSVDDVVRVVEDVVDVSGVVVVTNLVDVVVDVVTGVVVVDIVVGVEVAGHSVVEVGTIPVDFSVSAVVVVVVEAPTEVWEDTDDTPSTVEEVDGLTVEEVDKRKDTRPTVDFAVVGVIVVFVSCVDCWIKAVGMDSVNKTLERLDVNVVAAIIVHDVCVLEKLNSAMGNCGSKLIVLFTRFDRLWLFIISSPSGRIGLFSIHFQVLLFDPSEAVRSEPFHRNYFWLESVSRSEYLKCYCS